MSAHNLSAKKHLMGLSTGTLWVRVFFQACFLVDIFFFFAVSFMILSRIRSTLSLPNFFHGGLYFVCLFTAFFLTSKPRGWNLFGFLFGTAAFFECFTAAVMIFLSKELNLWRNLLMIHVVAGGEVFVPFSAVFLFRHLRQHRKAQDEYADWGQVSYFWMRPAFWAGVIGGTVAFGPPLVLFIHKFFSLAAMPLVAAHVLKAPRDNVEHNQNVFKNFKLSFAGGFVFFVLSAGFLYAFQRHPRLYRTPEISRANISPVKKGFVFLPSLVQTNESAVYDASALGPSKEACGVYGCHQFLFNEWKESPHAHANNIFFRKTLKDALRDKPPETIRYCLGCHAPDVLLSGKTNPSALVSSEGVSCIVCHSSYPHKNVGNGSYTFILPERFFTRVQTTFTSHSLKGEHVQDFMKPQVKSSDLCGACHRVIIPKELSGLPQDVPVRDAYASWKEGPYQKKQSCAYCHMPVTSEQERPGGLSRKFPSHRFASSNTAVPYLFHEEQQLKLTKDFLKSGWIKLKIIKIEKKEKQQLCVYVLTQNLLSGHLFPGGLLDLVDAWVELRAVSRNGNAVYTAKRAFGVKTYDKKGQEIFNHNFLNVRRKENERFLEVGEFVVDVFNFPVKLTSADSLTLHARLQFRKFRQKYVRWALEERNISIPVVTLSEDRKIIAFP